jgi:hypothetical protein
VAALGVLWQFALVGGAAVLYFLVRGLTQGDVDDAVGHGRDVLAFEARLHLDVETWVQEHVLAHRPLVTFANWVYMWGHWPVVAGTLLVLYLRRRELYLTLRNAMFVSGAIGLVIFATFPVAPPRLLDDGPFVDTVTRWSNSYRVLQPPSLVNKYAAVPSLHVGWNLLVGIALWHAFRSPFVRTFAVVGPTLMCLAVVATANHYVVDALSGAVISLIGLGIAVRITPHADEGAHEREVVDDQPVHAEGEELVDLLERFDAPDVERGAARHERVGDLGRQPVAANAHGIGDATAMTAEEPPELPRRADGPHHRDVLG